MKEKFNYWLKHAYHKSASDIHLTVNKPPVLRIHGKLMELDEERLTPEATKAICRKLLTDKAWQVLQREREMDFSYTLEGISRFRINAFYQRNHLSLAIRLIPTEIPSFEQLYLPSIVSKITTMPQGLVLVTGPTGSGKTTTLASMIDYMNKTSKKHIITLEDPIEYMHEHKNSLIDQREVGFDTLTFVNGLRASLRQDPDVIFVGEMRDLETISTAITAAETGHLVLSTLHTSDAISTIERVIDVFPAEQQMQIRIQLSNILKAVISQRLFPTADKKSRRVATEVLVNTPAVKNLIRNEKLYQIQNVLQTSKEFGMHTLEMDIRRLLNANIVNYETVSVYLEQ